MTLQGTQRVDRRADVVGAKLHVFRVRSPHRLQQIERGFGVVERVHCTIEIRSGLLKLGLFLRADVVAAHDCTSDDAESRRSLHDWKRSRISSSVGVNSLLSWSLINRPSASRPTARSHSIFPRSSLSGADPPCRNSCSAMSLPRMRSATARA